MSVNNTTFNGYITPVTTGSVSNSTYTSSTFNIPSYSFQRIPPKHIVEFYDSNGKPIVTLENNGSVTWHQSTEIDEAARIFGNTLTIAAEHKANITERVKNEIFDQVFGEIYEVFKNRESISGEELRIAYESSKIFRKLRGDK